MWLWMCIKVNERERESCASVQVSTQQSAILLFPLLCSYYFTLFFFSVPPPPTSPSPPPPPTSCPVYCCMNDEREAKVNWETAFTSDWTFVTKVHLDTDHILIRETTHFQLLLLILLLKWWIKTKNLLFFLDFAIKFYTVSETQLYLAGTL